MESETYNFNDSSTVDYSALIEQLQFTIDNLEQQGIDEYSIEELIYQTNVDTYNRLEEIYKTDLFISYFVGVGFIILLIALIVRFLSKIF